VAWMIRGALVLRSAEHEPERIDLVVEGDGIAAMGRDLDPAAHGVDRVEDGGGKLLTPGLINAHQHSHDRFDKGRFSPLPLEIWMALYNPPMLSRGWTPQEVYLRTLLGGMEMIRAGTTMVLDDVHHGLPLDRENVDAVYRAYDDLGLRADVSVAHADKPFYRGMPYLEECLPAAFKAPLKHPVPTPAEILALWRDLASRWKGRVRAVLSPSGPQRCTDGFLEETWQLARDLDLPVLIHVLETRIQALTAELFYGRSMVEHMHGLGILDRHAVLIHGVWMSSSDLDLVAKHGPGIVHNPGSNLKLGSGVAPVPAMRARGIPVGLGTDNHNANDNCSILEALKLAGLVHNAQDSDYARWIGAREAFAMATAGGAACAGLGKSLGSLEPGKQADFLQWDLSSNAFLPLNHAVNQLVYCEQGGSLERVVVAGQLIYTGGRFERIDEAEIMGEIRDRLDVMQRKIMDTAATGEALRPFLARAYDLCMKDPRMAPYLGRCNHPE
jgi:5-methylthioadenosine/S-adenosylhomocysteine deaminase